MFENAVGLVGEITSIEPIGQLCGIEYIGFLAKVKTKRPSGSEDENIVVFPKEKIDLGFSGERPELIPVGSRILITGKMQTLKDYETGRVLVYVSAEYVGLCPKAEHQNDIQLIGVIANRVNYRETPKGKRITDLMVKVPCQTPNTPTNKRYHYIPCICWQGQADEAASWKEGDKVELAGRLQSRAYIKLLGLYENDEPVRETRTAYEVSVTNIKRIGE